MQAELARLKAAGEAKALAEAVSPKPKRARATRGRPEGKRPSKSTRSNDDDFDAELRDLVDGFVAALREVIRRELIAQAKKRLT